LRAHGLCRVAPDCSRYDIYERAHAHFSEKELADLSIVIAMINAWNRLAISGRAAHPNDRPPREPVAAEPA
jgi:alkylhydroperoxidase family enzyme